MTTLDDTDEQVISLLRTNPRMTNRSIAVQLGISEPTVADRISKLEDSGLVQMILQWSTRALGLDFFCFLFVETEFGQATHVASQLASIDEISNVTGILGGHLLGADLAVCDSDAFFDLLANRVGAIEGIRTVRYVPFLQVIKLRNDVTTAGRSQEWHPKLDECRPRFQYDVLDQAIFEQLSRNARLSQRELGRILGENHARIRYRFKRYEEQHIFRHCLLVDNSTAGFNIGYFVRLLVRPDAIHTLARHLASMDWVPFVGLISGEFNLMLLAMGPSYEALDEQLGNLGSKEQQKMVLASEVLTYTNAYKIRGRSGVYGRKSPRLGAGLSGAPIGRSLEQDIHDHLVLLWKRFPLSQYLGHASVDRIGLAGYEPCAIA